MNQITQILTAVITVVLFSCSDNKNEAPKLQVSVLPFKKAEAPVTTTTTTTINPMVDSVLSVLIDSAVKYSESNFPGSISWGDPNGYSRDSIGNRRILFNYRIEYYGMHTVSGSCDVKIIKAIKDLNKIDTLFYSNGEKEIWKNKIKKDEIVLLVGDNDVVFGHSKSPKDLHKSFNKILLEIFGGEVLTMSANVN